MAVKVVGVGSVGTHCYVALLAWRANGSPLFLQVKEARRSVLEPYARRKSDIYPRNHGQRVVNTATASCKSASDIFLGWTKRARSVKMSTSASSGDMKISAQTELFSRRWMVEYAGFCGWALARAHARSGAPAPDPAQLPRQDRRNFDKAIATFASAYADQSERDHATLKKAARSGAGGSCYGTGIGRALDPSNRPAIGLRSN